MATLRTAEKDQNYLSLNENSIVWFAGTPEEHEESNSLMQPLELEPENPKDWDSILKCSGRRNEKLMAVTVAQGKENSLDINNESENLDFSGFWGHIGTEGQQVITIKGGSRHIRLAGPVYSRGTDCDIELGCHSDQSFRPSFDLNLSGLYGGRGQKLTVKIARIKDFWKTWLGMKTSIQLPEDTKILRIKSLGEYVYWWAKFAAVKIGILK